MSATAAKQLFVIIVNSVCNFLLASLKIIVGYIFDSQLLVADGIHSLSDLLTDIFAIVGLYVAKRPKDANHPLGHGNLEYASSLTVSILIIFMVYGLVVDLVEGWHVLPSSVNTMVLLVSVGTFIAKLLLSWYVLRQAKKLDSHTLQSSGIESLTDAYSTIIVIAGLILTDIGITYAMTWLIYAEKVATIVVIILLIKAAFEIYFNSAVGIAGTYAPEDVRTAFLAMIHGKVEADKEVYSLTECIVLKHGVDYVLYITIVFSSDMSLKDASYTLQEIKDILYGDTRVKKVNIEFSTDF